MLRGRVRFTVDGDEHELGPDSSSSSAIRRSSAARSHSTTTPSCSRSAASPESRTRDLGLGGDVRGRARVRSRSDWDEAIRDPREALAEQPEHAGAALQPRLHGGPRRPAPRRAAHLRRAVELEPKWAETRAKDTDFDSIRHEPGFPRLVRVLLAVAGEPRARGERAQRRHRVRFRPRDEQHRAERVVRDVSASTSRCSPTASANALCDCSPPNGTSSSGCAQAREHRRRT